jgi:hypothetical protein
MVWTLPYGPAESLRISRGSNRWTANAQHLLLPEKRHSGIGSDSSLLVAGGYGGFVPGG